MSATRTIGANDPAIRQAARYLSDATGLLILAGAGIGVDSGLPDFRGDTGFWRAYPLLRDAGIRLTDIAALDGAVRRVSMLCRCRAPTIRWDPAEGGTSGGIPAC